MMSTEKQATGLRWFTWLVVLAQVLGLTAVILIAVWMGKYRGGFAWQDNPSLEFNYHPLFLLIGMVFLQADAILVYRVFRNDRKVVIKALHASVHIAALLFTIVGLKAVFDSHNLPEKPMPNLYSLHSWIGLVTVLVFCAQWAIGMVTYLWPKLSEGLRQTLMPYHRFCGLTVFLLACATALMGIMEKATFSSDGMSSAYSTLPAEGVLINILGIIIAALAILVAYLVTKPEYKRQPTPDEEHISLTE